MKNSMKIFLDGDLRILDKEGLRKHSPGFLNGYGVFETLLCEKGQIYFLKEHYQRFLYGCDRYILPRPPVLTDIKSFIGQLLKENRTTSARVRLSAWRKGYSTHFAVIVVERESFPESVYRAGFAVCIYPKHLDRSRELSKIKSLDYRFFLNAYEYALRNHCHEALLINSSGTIVEGSRSNVFFVQKNKLFTPALTSGCLAGITRNQVLKSAKSVGVRAVSGEITLADAYQCQEAFLTNSLIGLMPLTSLGDHPIGSGRPGPLTSKVMKGYQKLSQAQGTFLL